MRGGCLSLYLGPAFLIARQPQPAVHLPTCSQTSFGLERVVQINRIPQQLRDVRARAQLSNKTGSVPG